MKRTGAIALVGVMIGLLLVHSFAQAPKAPKALSTQAPATPAPAASAQPAVPSALPSSVPPHPTTPSAPLELVTAEPNPMLPGQTVTFQWPEGAAKVLVSGGAYKARTPVTIGHPLTDKPLKTTTYAFDLWYPTVKAKPVAPIEPKGDIKPSGTPLAPVPPTAGHHHVQVTVEVYGGKFPVLVSYHDSHHWRMDIIDGWKRSDDAAPEIGSTVVYLQPEEDSAERIAVATMLAEKMSSADLMRKAVSEAPTQYDVMLDVVEKDTTQCGEPAQWTFFRGIDRAQPGIPTKSMVLALVHAGRGYVISARTTLSKFDERVKLLRCLVRSFAFDSAPPSQVDKEGKVLAYGKPAKLTKAERLELQRGSHHGGSRVQNPGPTTASKPKG